MFFAEGQIRVHLYGQPTDMRKSYDGLQALARHAMGHDPLDGALYIFVNRRGSQIKCLYFGMQARSQAILAAIGGEQRPINVVL
jgi:transposase